MRVGPRWYEDEHSSWLEVLARIGRGDSFERAAAEATAVLRASRTAGEGSVVRPTVVLGGITGDRDPAGNLSSESRVAALLTALSTALLLLSVISCVALLAARNTARAWDWSVRYALGASPFRIFAMRAFEGICLVGLGAWAGLVLVLGFGTTVLRMYLPGIEWAWSTFAARLVSGATMLFLGLAAAVSFLAMRWSRPSMLTDLQTRAGSLAKSRTGTILLASEVLLATVLLYAAATFSWAAWQTRNEDLGFEPDRVATTVIRLPSEENLSRPAVYAQAVERIRVLPGVEAAAAGLSAPFHPSFGIGVSAPDSHGPGTAMDGPYGNAVTASYFKTLGMRITRGRGITNEDRFGDERVTVVNESLARAFFPAGEAVGQCIIISADTDCTRIVGVVRDVPREAIREGPTMQFYVPLAQRADLGMPGVLLVRTKQSPDDATQSLNASLEQILPNTAVAELRPLFERLQPQIRPIEMGFALFSVLAVLTLLVACLGAYANVSQALASRRREIAIRASLGASPRRIALLVTRRSIGAAAAGLFAGALTGWVLLPRAIPDALRSGVPQGWVLLAVSAVLGVASSAAMMKALKLVFDRDLARVLCRD